MLVFRAARLINVAVILLFDGLFELESYDDSNKYPAMVAKLFR